MSILETVVFFLIIWWPIFFISLPFGFKPITNGGKNKNYAKSAPAQPKILKKFFITTLVSLIITIIIWSLSFFEIISFKELII